MELPKALESLLGVLLSNHHVSSWKITADGNTGNPTVVLRLQSVCEYQHGEHVNTQVFRRKSQGQLNRDRRRMESYIQRSDHFCKAKSNNMSAGLQNAAPCEDINPMPSRNVHGKGIDIDSASKADIESEECTGSTQVGQNNNSYTDQSPSFSHVRSPKACESHRDGSAGQVETGDGSGNSGEEREGDNTAESSEKHYPSLFPDFFPIRSTYSRESSAMRSPLDSGSEKDRPTVSPLVPDARETGRGSAAAMEVTPGNETEEADGTESSNCATDGEGAGEGEDTFLVTVRDKVTNAKCSPSIFGHLARKDRNNAFEKVVIDRRVTFGRGFSGAERVVCKANDVVLTYDTGNGSLDFHIIERRLIPGAGDDFSRCCMMWPGIDRGGVYKDRIDQMTYDLKRSMVLVRGLLSGR